MGLSEAELEYDTERLRRLVNQQVKEFEANPNAPPSPKLLRMLREDERRSGFHSMRHEIRKLAEKRDPTAWMISTGDYEVYVDFTKMQLIESSQDSGIDREFILRRGDDAQWSRMMTTETREFFAVRGPHEWEACDEFFAARIDPQYRRFVRS